MLNNYLIIRRHKCEVCGELYECEECAEYAEHTLLIGGGENAALTSPECMKKFECDGCHNEQM